MLIKLNENVMLFQYFKSLRGSFYEKDESFIHKYLHTLKHLFPMDELVLNNNKGPSIKPILIHGKLSIE